MLPQNNPDRIRIAFDDHRLVANAGLLLPAILARHLGLRELGAIDTTSERVRTGLDRAKAEGKRLGRPPALTPEQVQECRRMYAGTPSIHRVARIMKVSQGTVKRALEPDAAPVAERK